ncbi:hypothetical protein F4778DRAFT_299917 [Xylariomycetidae sp. FL2044]|nr:hypothetical protein F4778DRAFT_299917 [Xylariomycetidae sp. FL2044]
MATDLLPENLSYLTDAAHLLATASPEISAHLMTQRKSLMLTNDIHPPDLQREHVCGSCGHIMIPGQGDVLKFETEKAVRHQRRRQVKSTTPIRSRGVGCKKRITCDMCGRYTLISFPTAPPALKHGVKKRLPPGPLQSSTCAPILSLPSASHPSGSAVSTGDAPKPSANANSKKRAKNRKQGLQALLQQSANSKSQMGLGLSLSDFMKK